MRTIPHMCLACSEIVDVAIPIDETEPSGCPMCGGELTCDFDMPANEHVTIEVQTPERLTIRYPMGIAPFAGYDVAAICVNNIPHVAIVLFLVAQVHSAVSPMNLENLALIGIGLICWFALINVVAFAQRWGCRMIELNPEYLVIRICFARLYWTQKVRAAEVQKVYLREFRIPHMSTRRMLGVHVKLPFGVTRERRFVLANDRSPDLARYITHLLRRQLITMGHDLQDA